ncbi:phosphodiester glycosidase family protein [bacterium]|nr:phosphodiester glycosidase family protein [bacterium]
MQIKENLRYFFKVIFIILIISCIISPDLYSKTKKKRRSHRPKIVKIDIKSIDTLDHQILHEGIHYYKLNLGNGSKHFSVHFAEIDLKNNNITPIVIKSGNQINGLEKLPLLFQRYNETFIDSLLIAINANFWRAYSNSPIGPTIINGEVIELSQHKNWSSFFIDNNGVPYIDNFNLSGKIIGNNEFKIKQVNRRSDSLGIVLYNHFAGDTIPFVQNRKIQDALDSAYIAWVDELPIIDGDSIEFSFDSLAFIEDYKSKARENMIEKSLTKVLVQYIDSPVVNKQYRAIVKDTSNYTIKLPLNCAVISFGKDIPPDLIPKIGDTLSLIFMTNNEQDKLFKWSVCGSPRLVRNGTAKQESAIEGNDSRRFINYQLPRTAIGFNKSRTKLLLAVVEGTNSTKSQYGASLQDLARIMKAMGAFDAMNLDGGGSSTFVIQGKNLLRNSDSLNSRKLSVIFGIKKK